MTMDVVQVALGARAYEVRIGQGLIARAGGAPYVYTPRSVVKTLVEMLEPYQGRVYDPAAGSGGMFVQSAEFVKAHGGKRTTSLSMGRSSRTRRGSSRR